MTALDTAVEQPRTRRTVMMLAGVAAAMVVADAVVGITSGSAAVSTWAWASYTLALAGIVVAGAVLIRDRVHTGLGELLLAAAAAGALADIASSASGLGPLGFLSGIVYWGWAGLLTHVLVRWPDARVRSRPVRALLLGLYVLMPALSLLWQLTWDAHWFDGPARRSWWLTLLPARDFSATVFQVQQGLFIALIAALVVIVLVRVARADRDRRLVMLPVAVTSVALAVAVAAAALEGIVGPSPVDVVVLQNVTLLAIPVGVLVAALRRPHPDAVAPGRRLPPGDAVRLRYRFGLGSGAAALVLLVVLAVVLQPRGAEGTLPAPAPGPAVVAPAAVAP